MPGAPPTVDARAVAEALAAGIEEAEDAPLDPSDPQRDAIAGLVESSPRVDHLSYDGRRGALRRLRGVLFVDRDEDALSVAARYLASEGSLLVRAIGIEESDRLRATDVTPSAEHAVAVVHFERLHDEHVIVDDHIEITVTSSEHLFGPGVVTEVAATWHRRVDDAQGAGVSETEAVSLARAALGVADHATGSASRRYQCAPSDLGEGCKLVWTVRFDRPQHPGEHIDTTVELDAVRGTVLAIHDGNADNAGYIHVVASRPFTSTWDNVRVPRLEVVATSGSSRWVTQTDEDSSYTQSAPSGAATTIALTTRDWSVTSMKHSSEATWYDCAGLTLQPLTLSFTGYASGTTTLTPSTAARTIPRANWGIHNFLHYVVDTLADHVPEAEFPSQIWWTANSDDAGNAEYFFTASTIPCNSTTGIDSIGISGDAKPENQDRVRHTAGHEVIHAIQ